MPPSDNEVERLLRAIAEGYPVRGEGDRYVVVTNPAFKEDDGSAPCLCIDVDALSPPTTQEGEEVERVARALARHDNPKHENWWPSYESRARAAIAALSPGDDERVKALEDAAKLAEGWVRTRNAWSTPADAVGDSIAKAIRALSTSPDQSPISSLSSKKP